jgi:protein involved in polysaccharide export with SLBB domain
MFYKCNKFLPVFFFLFCSFVLHSQNKYTQDPSIIKDPTGYKLRTGDRIRIFVQGETDATVEATISSFGGVRPYYLKEIKLSGLSAEQASEIIAREYKTQLIYQKPTVTVVVLKHKEQMVFLSGSLARKGPFVLPPEVEAMSIVEVISRSGGFSDIAKKNKVYVTRTYYNRNGEETNTKTYEVDVEALSKGTLTSRSAKRFWIYPGDRIQVPERLL